MRNKRSFSAIIALSVVAALTAQAELTATFLQGDQTDVRLDRLAAISVSAGQSPTPFLKAGKFEVKWTGALELDKRRRLIFSFAGNGKAVLTIDGKEVLQEEGVLGAKSASQMRLNAGSHEFSLSYTSADDGAGNFRLYWEEADMLRQTVSPTAFRVVASDELNHGELKRHGRQAFAKQNCIKCHAPSDALGATAMPELNEIAPIVSGIGTRVREDWLRKWLVDPKAMKPTTTMPNLIDPKTPEGLRMAADLAAFMIPSKAAESAVPAVDPAKVKAGGAHFHELGCVACHDLPGKESEARVPLNNVASKYLPGQLEVFLKKPEAYHPYTSMPNFHLTDDEAASLASFLTAESSGKETKMTYEFPAGDPLRGAAVAESLQCGVCHPGLPGAIAKTPKLDQIFTLDWAVKGCVSEGGKRPELPVLNFRAGEQEALIAFSKMGHSSLRNDNPVEFAARQISSKRCTGCHDLDGKSAVLNDLHGSTAHLSAPIERVDQSRPQLTFIGEMLFTDFIESMLAGTVEQRPRPWLGTRMPAFPAYAKPLAEGMSRMHGYEPAVAKQIEVDAALAEIGKNLVGASGFGCTTCHGVGKQEPTAAFEVGAVNFELTPRRLREDYFHRWMDNPPAVIPGNKMPRYAEGKESSRSDILEGDASKQYNAIWHWLHAK